MNFASRKAERTLNRALKGFFSVKSFDTAPVKEQMKRSDFLSHALNLSGKRLHVLTDAGLAHLRTMITVLQEADIFNGTAEPEDVAITVRSLLTELLSQGQMPDDGQELARFVRERLEPEVQNRTFAVPMYGVQLDGVDEVDLIFAKIVRSPLPAIDAVRVSNEYVQTAVDARRGYSWLLGTVRGTPARAEKKFREQAQMATGFLALLAAARYQWGAIQFRIGIVTTPAEDVGSATWFSWCDGSDDLTVHNSGGRTSPLNLNPEVIAETGRSDTLQYMLKVASSGGETELERALVKSLYWFSDAHRDPVAVMQFVKYWSCAETFFSGSRSNITKSLSSGLAAVLVHGGFRFVPEAEYVPFKQRVTKLYGLRSSALHGGVYEGFTDRDVADLSQWTAWLLICMANFALQGFESLSELRQHIDRIDRSVDETSGTSDT